jgi:hypothetical protein
MKPGNHEEHIRHIFDSYCKKIVKQAAIDIQRDIKRRNEREIAFSAMSARELAELATTDAYFTDAHIFSVHGENVGVTDCDLGRIQTHKHIKETQENIGG